MLLLKITITVFIYFLFIFNFFKGPSVRKLEKNKVFSLTFGGTLQ